MRKLPDVRPIQLVVLLAGALTLSGLSVAAPASSATTPTNAQVWTRVSDKPLASRGGLTRSVDPSSYAGYHLDLGALSARLDRAPLESARGAAPMTISVPSPSGELVEFSVEESPVMEAGLAAEHPDIHTYAGKTVGASPASIRLDITPLGFHASVRGDGASWYVDPAYNGLDQGPDALYLSYAGADLPERQQQLVEPDVVAPDGIDTPAPDAQRAPDEARIGEGGGQVATQRTYRLALATDPTYAAYFSQSSDPTVVDTAVTSAKVTLMNRVNQVYGDDLSVRMILVDGNDVLNFNTDAEFTGTNGPCGQVACYTGAQVGSGCIGATLDRNRYVIGQLIGADKYDIGHLAFGVAGGGIAGLGVVGTAGKAKGCTGLSPPTGDGFAVDYVAHEMGHEFDGNHTFNGTTDNCGGGNRNGSTSVEPGSGTSIMAYAGICGVDNLQLHSDPYFSQRSQSEIAAFTRSTPGTDNEVQNVALSGFDATDSLRLNFGSGASTPITNGSTYTTAGIKAAVEAAEPSAATATVTGYWGQGAALTNGFQITWSGTADIATPTVTVAGGTFTSQVGTTDNGGPETNQGYNNPTPTGNHNPSVTAPAAATIPIRTPFQLTGSATDADSDSLVYLWEQNDRGGNAGTTLNSNTKATGPLFRIFGTYANVTPAGSQQYDSPGLNLATGSPTRSFPDLAQVVAGATNAATGSCPSYTGTGATDTAALDCFSEFLPTTARALNFRLTARDLSGADGGTSYADTTLTVGAAGPFQVTSQASAPVVGSGTVGTVAWAVNGTGVAPYAPNVKISLSTDGGLTFPTVLAASTPNDGTENITWPQVTTTTGRIKIDAVDNYFYDVNDAPISIIPGGPTVIDPVVTPPPADTTAPDTQIVAGPAEGSIALLRDVTFLFSSEPGATYTCTLSGVALPCAAGSLTLPTPGGGTYDLRVTATDAAGNSDPTPATRRFVVPFDVAALKASSGWKRKTSSAAFRDTYVQAKRAQSTLTYRVSGASLLVLVVDRSKSSGKVDVFLGKRKLKTVNTKGAPASQLLIPVSLRGATSGKVMIRTRDARKVRVDGLAVVSATPPAHPAYLPRPGLT